ncbi:MAG: VWA domain-containing protein, partial [Treponema sp.]|nr:VWA domain-containing protein [Treponema sp.]
MKKLLIALVVAASLATPFPASAQEQPVDLIVLLDASQSMFPYFTEVVDFVVSRIAREYLRFGDTFHLLTFTDSVRIEIAQSVRTEQDLKSLLGRLYL